MIPTWKLAEAKMSVEMNGTYILFENPPDTMPRYVRPALFSTGDEKWELQVCGSAFLAKYHGWFFGLATAHQTDTAATRDRFRAEAGWLPRPSKVTDKLPHLPRRNDEAETFDDIKPFHNASGQRQLLFLVQAYAAILLPPLQRYAPSMQWFPLLCGECNFELHPLTTWLLR